MEISKFYHRARRMAEEREHLRKLRKGDPVRLGGEYIAVTARDGSRHEGPFTALAYEDGLLMAGTADRRFFVFIDDDAAAVGSELYTEDLPLPVRFKTGLPDILAGLGGEEEGCRALRSACSVKWMCPLSTEEARLLFRWYRRNAGEEQP